MLKETVKYAAAVVFRPFIGPGRKVVLCYHSLRADAVANFRQQMQYLVNCSRVVQPSQILSSHSEDTTIAAVTFDDAFESFYEYAVPVLKEFQIKAGVFVPTDYIGQNCGWAMPQRHPDKAERVITHEKIVDLQKAGIEVFSHSMSHPALTQLSDKELTRELTGSKQRLEQILGNSVTGISYPHGKHDRRVLEAARASGYRTGFTIEPQWVSDKTDPLAIGRFVVSPYEPLSRFKLKACGAYAIENGLRKIKRRFT